MCLQAVGHEALKTQVDRQCLNGIYRFFLVVFMLPVVVISDLHYDSSVLPCSKESLMIA